MKHLKALELARVGDWDASHKLVQALDDTFSFRIHAYLHRVEGDLPNARYWYRRAGYEENIGGLDTELQILFNELRQDADEQSRQEPHQGTDKDSNDV